jgi:hypothetical protein
VQGAFQLTGEAAGLVTQSLVNALLLHALNLTPEQYAGGAQYQQE